MHKFCSLNSEVSASDLPIHSEDEFIEACKVTRGALHSLHEHLNSMLSLTEKSPDQTVLEQFNTLKSRCQNLICNTEYRNRVLFDGHIDVDIVFTGSVKDTVRIRIPNLIDKLHTFHCNFQDVIACDTTEFARQARASEAAQIHSSASVQAVRLNTFMPRTVKASRLAAINSLTGLTGLYAMSYGNAMVGPANSQDTHMPLHCGCIYINRVAIPESDGTVSSLIKQINNASSDHGVCAVGEAGESVVLIDKNGRTIDIRITNQSAALLSGFPLGASEMPSRSNGLMIWMNFRHLSEVQFDCEHTGQFMTGKMERVSPLDRYQFDSLSLESENQRLLSRHVLDVMQTIVIRESNYLDIQLKRLQQLFSNQQKLHQTVALDNADISGRIAH